MAKGNPPNAGAASQRKILLASGGRPRNRGNVATDVADWILTTQKRECPNMQEWRSHTLRGSVKLPTPETAAMTFGGTTEQGITAAFAAALLIVKLAEAIRSRKIKDCPTAEGWTEADLPDPTTIESAVGSCVGKTPYQNAFWLAEKALGRR